MDKLYNQILTVIFRLQKRENDEDAALGEDPVWD